MTTATTAFDPAWAAGTRTKDGFLTVDAGTMCLATSFPADDEWMDADDRGAGWTGPGWVCTLTGYGDGGYDLLQLTAPDGTVTGLEVVFCSAAIESAGESAETGPAPTDEERQAVYDRTASAEVLKRYEQWLSAGQAALNDAWERLVTTIDPASETTPHLLAELTLVDGQLLHVGDPCYRRPSRSVPLPAGRYAVVSWTEATSPASRVARVGAYRIR